MCSSVARGKTTELSFYLSSFKSMTAKVRKVPAMKALISIMTAMALQVLVLPAVAASFPPKYLSYQLAYTECGDQKTPFTPVRRGASVDAKTTLEFAPVAQDRGVVQYRSYNRGLVGDDCRQNFRADYELSNGYLVLRPIRGSAEIESGWDLPCQSLRADQIRRLFLSISSREDLILVGEDETRQCDSSVPGGKIRFTFKPVSN